MQLALYKKHSFMTTSFYAIPVDFVISHHARCRARQRFSLTGAGFQKLASRALVYGIPREQTRGQLRRYLDELWMQYGTANNIRLYGEYLFLFSGALLITTWHLPAAYRKHATRYSRIRKNKTIHL